MQQIILMSSVCCKIEVIDKMIKFVLFKSIYYTINLIVVSSFVVLKKNCICVSIDVLLVLINKIILFSIFFNYI